MPKSISSSMSRDFCRARGYSFASFFLMMFWTFSYLLSRSPLLNLRLRRASIFFIFYYWAVRTSFLYLPIDISSKNDTCSKFLVFSSDFFLVKEGLPIAWLFKSYADAIYFFIYSLTGLLLNYWSSWGIYFTSIFSYSLRNLCISKSCGKYTNSLIFSLCIVS